MTTDRAIGRRVAAPAGRATARPIECVARCFRSARRRFAILRWAACIVAAHLGTIAAQAAELCHFAGTTDYAGRLEVDTTVSAHTPDGTTTVDVVGSFFGTPLPLVHIRYLMQEISAWKADQLQSVAVNSRYIVDGHVIRQEWDVFDRGAGGLEASRLQGKTPGDIQRRYPAFIRHWDPASFGQPWLSDYRAAGAERRRDLDLPASSVRPDLRSPLALAFYWSRRLPAEGQATSVFLPGFKRDKRVDLTIAAAGPLHAGQQLWQTSVRYPGLSLTEASTAKAWVSGDGHLLRLAGTVQSGSYTAYGVISQDHCSVTADAATPNGR